MLSFVGHSAFSQSMETVYMTGSMSAADLKLYLCGSMSCADQSIYLCGSMSCADKKIYIANSMSSADVVIYVDEENELSQEELIALLVGMRIL